MTTRPRGLSVYRALTRLYPSAFRREFGPEIEREFMASLSEATSGTERLRVWRHALGDMAVSMLREHWDTWTSKPRRGDMRGLSQDVRRAARSLRAAPTATLIAALSLALGIGATTVIFSVVYGVLLAPLPYPDAGRIVSLYETFENTPGPVAISYVNAQDWRRAQTTLDSIALARGGALTLVRPEGVQQVSTLFADSELFEVLGVRAAEGRLFGADDNRVPGHHPVAVLSHDAWRRLFSAEPGVVGRTLNLSGTPFTVIGILPADFRDPFGPVNGRANDLIVPAMMVGQIDPRGNAVLDQRRVRTFGGIGKVRKGVTVAQADADLQRIATHLQETSPVNRGTSVRVVPFSQAVAAGIRGPALTLLGGAVVLLIIACFSVGSVLMVRRAARARELAIHVALGAGRRRLFRLLTLEGVLLALAGGGLGVIVAYLILPSVLAVVPTQLPSTADVRLGLPVLGFALAVSVLVGAGVGMLPALRPVGVDVNLSLSGSSRAVGDRRGERVRNALVFCQIVTATILLATSVLLVSRFRALTVSDPGFVTGNVLTVNLNLPASTYPNGTSLAAAAADLAERIAGLPDVLWAEPWGPGRPGLSLFLQTSIPDGMPVGSINEAPLARRHAIGPGAMEGMGISLVRGRTFTRADDSRSPPVAVISESMAEALWPGEDPIGRQYHGFQPSGSPIPANRHWTVIGVVRDARHGGRAPLPGTLVTSNDSYFAFAQQPERAFTMLVKTRNEPDVDPIRDVITKFDPNIAIVQATTMAENLRQEEAPSRFAAQLMGGFGLVALFLAALGVYGVTSFSVLQREQEIGLRAALGARPGNTLGQFMRYSLTLAASGVVVGAATAYGANRALQAVVPTVPDMDGPAVALAAVVLILVAMLSCLVPALRATRIPPVMALRGP